MKMNTAVKASLLTALFSTGLILSLPYAIADTTSFAGKNPSSEEIADQMLPKAKTRGISVGTTAGMAAPSAAPKVSFDQIKFQFNSAELTPESTSFLEKIGSAISTDKLNGYNFEVQGHTDAKGSAAYNMALSKRRAESVKKYLVAHYKIDAKRLKAVGKGKTDLLDKEDPESAVNRRVVFVTVGG